MIYFTDWNDEKEYGSLKIYQGGESVKIADDVHSFFKLSDGHILYLSDYSTKHNNGEFYEWKNGDARKIDEDVVGMIRISKSNTRKIGGEDYG